MPPETVKNGRASLVFVLGMHRSGTSLATRMVQACGFQVPGQALSANADNPQGYSEPRALVRANNRILSDLERHWADDRPFDPQQQQAVFSAWQPRAQRLLRMWTKRQQLLVLKDPRLCLTFPLWRQAAQAMGADIRVLLITRDAQAVFASLRRRYDTPAFRPAAITQQARSDLLCQRYTLWAEWNTRDLVRAQVDYEQLLANDIAPLRSLLQPWWPQDDAPSALVQRPKPGEQAPGLERLANPVNLKSAPESALQIQLDHKRRAYQTVQARFAGLRSIMPPAPQADPVAPALLRALQNAQAAPETQAGHVLFISGVPSSRGHIYRVEHAAAALRERGMRVDIIEQPERATLQPDSCAVVLFRLRWSAELQTLTRDCKQRGIALIYDIDDAVFDAALMIPEYFDYVRVRADQQQHWSRSAPQYQTALQQCDAAVVTTEPLAERARTVQPDVYVVPNGLAGNRMSATPHQPTPGVIRIGYASGTPTHQKDFAEVAPALVEVLAGHAHVRLCVLGHLNLGEFPALEALGEQIEQRPLVDFDQLPEELARFDINLAPLQRDNPFCDCKSELKYFEAAAVGVVTIASDTPPMRDAIIDGDTGFIANNTEQWRERLNRLIEQPELRHKCARRARLHARAIYGPQPRGEWYVSVFCRIVDDVRKRRDQTPAYN